MNSQRNKKTVITYPAETLKSFDILAYEWIDNLNFTLNPKDCIDRPEEYISIAKEMFLEDGWDGDGEIELMWIPPFMFDPSKLDDNTKGVTVWHVKQLENGISWILFPKGTFDKTR